MPNKDDKAKTTRTNRNADEQPTGEVCEHCQRPILIKDLLPVKLPGKGQVYYHKEHYKKK